MKLALTHEIICRRFAACCSSRSGVEPPVSEQAQGTGVVFASMKFTSGHAKSSLAFEDSFARISRPKQSTVSYSPGPRSANLLEEDYA